jgi:hypothetical protein
MPRNFPNFRFITKSSKIWLENGFFPSFSSQIVLNRTKKNKFSNLAGYTPLKYVFSEKLLITRKPEVGKFENWMELKDNYPTNRKNTHRDFSDNFHNITR